MGDIEEQLLTEKEQRSDDDCTIDFCDERSDVECGNDEFQILGGNLAPEDLALVPTPSVDPFRNNTHDVTGVWEWIKIILCSPLLILRVVMTSLILVVGFLCTKLALCGWDRKQNLKALPQWRRKLMWSTRACARGILFCFGFHWIRRIGRPAPREVAPIVVSNHVSYIDPIFYIYELFPTIVSSSSHDDMLFVGTIIRAMQVILVDRASSNSRRDAVAEIKRRAANSDFPRVLLFPEGTTTNGRSLISFKAGAFVPGFPIQPVVIRYPHIHFDPSWGNISLWRLVPRMLLQFHNFMEVQYLPVIYPTSGHPTEYSDTVKYAMAVTLNVPQTEHTYEDLMLSVKASNMKLFPLTLFMVEMGRMEKHLQLKISDVNEYMDKFLHINLSRSGLISKSEFSSYLGLPNGQDSEEIFNLFDRRGRGWIDFQEFVTVSSILTRHKDFATLHKLLFERFDSDGDGVLVIEEVEDILHSSSLPQTAVKMLSKRMDEDRRGALQFKDSERFFEKNPENLFLLHNITGDRKIL